MATMKRPDGRPLTQSAFGLDGTQWSWRESRDVLEQQRSPAALPGRNTSP